LLGSDAFRTDIIGISTPTKWNYQITEASEIPGNNGKGFYIARSGRPGPFYDITKMRNLMNLSSVIKQILEVITKTNFKY
jgi:acetolactate synthase-1/2/3 large subunit